MRASQQQFSAGQEGTWDELFSTVDHRRPSPESPYHTQQVKRLISRPFVHAWGHPMLHCGLPQAVHASLRQEQLILCYRARHHMDVMCAANFAFCAPISHVRTPNARRQALCSLRACFDAPPQAVRHYVNLTNGIEALRAISDLLPPDEVRFTRLQSSHAEAGAYNKILAELDHDLLWSIASGHRCYIYDFASRNPKRGVPRSFFVSLQFIRWALMAVWFGKDDVRVPQRMNIRGKDVVRFWKEDVYPYQITKDTKKRLRYYTPYADAANLSFVDLRGVYGRSSAIDGKKDVHVGLARSWLDKSYPEHCAKESTATSFPVHDTETGDSQHGAWMKKWRLVEFDPDVDADELRRLQVWMKEPQDVELQY